MNTIEDDGGQKREILIIRRPRHDEDDGHHGGVWKIAFADFMTAMMCFFLVMWLINAANEETRAALASYFNPVKLIDRNASRKGLDEIGGPQTREAAPENADDDSTEKENLTEPGSPVQPTALPSLQKSEFEPRSDEHLFSDPYAVLAEIAAETGTLQNTSSKGDGGAGEAGPASGASGGESYRDPFAPDFWSRQVDVPEAAATAEAETLDPAAGLAEVLAAAGEEKTPGGPAEEAEKEPAEDALAAKAQQLADAPPADDAEPAAIALETDGEKLPAGLAEDAVAGAEAEKHPGVTETAPVDPVAESTAAAEKAVDEAGKAQTPAELAEAEPDAAAEDEAEAAVKAEAEKTAEAIREELADALGAEEAVFDGITVTVTDEGVMISIADQADFGMFEIGSAVPRRDLVLAMEKIGRILGQRAGAVTINGHTDGRPFRSEAYDNWRLSTARAHSAYFMLVRGGLEEERIMKVAGFADRRLKVAEDPLADANRRIEILLAAGG